MENKNTKLNKMFLMRKLLTGMGNTTATIKNLLTMYTHMHTHTDDLNLFFPYESKQMK